MSQKITKCLNEENVRLLCSFINKAFSKDEIIDDINIKSDGVFSSYYTTKLLQQLKTDNENYTNTVFGELTHLTCEETNILPTLDITEVNTLYLYSATLTSPYQQYLKISDGNTEKLIDLGSTSISLSEYMKAIDIANTYTTKIETQAIVDTIGDKTDLETTAKDTLVNAINEIKEGLDNCITKDAIVTTIDDTVTDDQVPSAKVVYDKLQEVFQSSNDTQNAYETAIIGKGGTVSKASNVATKREILDGIESISVGEGEDIAPIHDTMTDLGYNATNLTNLSVDKTAHIISKWFILKSTTDNVDTILDVANTDDTDTFTDWITDDEITDFGDYINPTYSATQLTVSEDTTSGMFVSEELTVDELCAVNEGEVN